MLKYPAPLLPGSTIAITAFSGGIQASCMPRFHEIVRTLEERGLKVVIGDCLSESTGHVSAPAEVRAAELQAFLMDNKVDAIAPPWGGELAMEILPLLDFDALQHAKPKWVFGFSDVSTITAVLHSRLGWATAHCSNLMDVIDTATDPLTANTLNYLATPAGDSFTQHASEKFTEVWPDISNDPLACIQGDQSTQWQWLVPPSAGDVMRGRLIGGCWDTLIHLFESPYLSLEQCKRRSEGELLLFLENVEMSPCDLTRAILNMQFRGVFNHVSGLILGRNFRKDPVRSEDLTYLDVLKRHLTGLGIPVLIDADIGHAPPNLTLINGAQAEVGTDDNRWFIRQSLI